MKQINKQVVIVDDDEAMRHSLQWMLEGFGYEIQTFPSADKFLLNYQQNWADCMLLDVRMPGMGGLELQAHLKQQGLFLPIIIISGHGDIDMAVQAMKAGAVDFIEKPFDDKSLLNAIEKASNISQIEKDKQLLQIEIKKRLASLTPREYEVLEMVTQGLVNKKMAADLGVSTKTIEAHRARVMDKMKAASLAELVRMTVIAEQ